MPPWVGSGGIAALLQRMSDASARERIDRDFVTGLPGWQNLVGGAGWANVVIAGCPSDPSLEGLSVAEIAAGTGKSPADVACDIVHADAARTVVVLHMMAEEDVTSIRGWEAAMLGSDGVPLPGKPHPRIAGTFARALRAPVATDPWAGVADRVHRMTGMPARRYQIPGGRGTLAHGVVADVVVFDPATVTDRSTYPDPLLAPVGIEHVLVAGQVSLHAGALTGRFAGRVLRAR
jgi:N-acyl-D-aspartate/D-glutamate deacylase